MQDRGMMKWNSFDNFGTNKTIIKKLDEERKKIKMPILSEEQITNINNKISWYYLNKKVMTAEYYLNGYLCQSNGIIIKIDMFSGYIKVNNDLIYFNQIINIK